jgi:hypothetical protein
MPSLSHNIPPTLWSPGPKASNPRTPRNLTRTTPYPGGRGSPYASPGQVRFSNGVPMELKTPKKHMEDKVASRRHASSRSSPGMSPGMMGPPGVPLCAPGTPTHARPTGSNPTPPLFPPQLRLRRSSSSLTPVEMNHTPKRERRAQDPARPTVQLLRVLNKCWSEDTSTQVRWSLKDGLLNGRCEELDRSRMWDTLGHAVGNVWPHLRGWIMHHIPSDDNTEWFSGADRIDAIDEGVIADPDIATKYSSLERVGFFSTHPSFNVNSHD